MKTKKYTHITARVYKTAKEISICQLKKYCGCTLSDAYWRMEEGKGLVSLYDQESFETWSELMNGVLHIKPLSRLMPIEYDDFCAFRSNIWDRMEAYRRWLDRGSDPLYIRHIAMSIGIEDIFLYHAAERLFNFERGAENDDEMKEKLIVDSIRLSDAFERRRQEQIDNGEKPDNLYVRYTGVYQIRADYSHKVSDSEEIRHRLDGIWSVPNKTSKEHREIYRRNASVIAEFNKYKKLPKVIADYNFYMDFLKLIQIPEFEEVPES